MRLFPGPLPLSPGLRALLLVGPPAFALVALGARLPVSTAGLLGWNAGVLAYLAASLRVAMTASPAEARRRAEALDRNRWVILAAVLAAVLASLGAVVLDLSAVQGAPGFWRVTLALATVLLSWCFVHVLFANHYAHEHRLRGGLVFPGGGDEPDLGEFLYLAFTVGMTAQVSDVSTSSPAMRRLVLAHGLVSFLFNAAVVAAAVNIVAGLANG